MLPLVMLPNGWVVYDPAHLTENWNCFACSLSPRRPSVFASSSIGIMTANSDNSSNEAVSATVDMEKNVATKLENVPTHDRVPGHTNYYERNGLRTVGGE
jgi:hypothetical protein